MTEIVFTLCSRNYLAHASVLAESLRLAEPGIGFFIGLVDQEDSTLTTRPIDFPVIPAMNVCGGECLEWLSRYDLVEFNTAVKARYFRYFFRTFPEAEAVVYLDPDILVFRPLDEVREKLKTGFGVLTPHLLQSVPAPGINELGVLRTGLFNLGFIALRRGSESAAFLDWWDVRLAQHCYMDKRSGLYVDQKWIDLAFVLFPGFEVIRHKGYNVAWWNFPERTVLVENGAYCIGDHSTPLVFFHFSGFRMDHAEQPGRTSAPEFSIGSQPHLRQLYVDYAARLQSAGYEYYQAMTPGLPFRKNLAPSFFGRILRRLKRSIS